MKKMMWYHVCVFFSIVISVLSINRPVYKAVLTQKGYAQFLQYDIETPPIREFTFCTWFRIYELIGDQTIFAYVANGNNRVIRLWLDSSGKSIKVLINGKVSSTSAVDIAKDVWRHVCLSYQSDYGAWAVYMDSRLISCQSSQSVNGFVLPEGGSVIVGYGTDSNGGQNGLQGEIFGANMILISTIERNYTIKINPTYEQKPFHRNRMKGGEIHPNYVILNDLQSDEINNSFETTLKPVRTTTSKGFIKFKTPHSFIEHEVGQNVKTKDDSTHTFLTDILSFPETTESISSNSWHLNTEAHKGKYRIRNKNKKDQHQSSSKYLPIPSEYEIPPPISESIYKAYEVVTEYNNRNDKNYSNNLSEIELPPPISKSNKVYGQWTSSKFAGSVLNYLKSQQVHLREQKRIMTPQTIPLVKISDSFPYASDFRIMKIRPQFKYQRRNLVERQQFESKKQPQINLQILEDDLRNNIIKYHAQTMPKHVEITNRGMTNRRQEHRFYRNTENQNDSQENPKNNFSNVTTKSKTIIKEPELNLQSQDLMTILPFLKTLEYFIQDSSNTKEEKSLKSNNDAYTRSLSLGNKWHNVKSYSNDYTPRAIKVGFNEDPTNIDEKIAQINKRHPAIRLKYKHENRKVVQYRDDDSIMKGRELAMEVSNTSDYNKDGLSIFKYNHGYLPTKSNNKISDKIRGKYEKQVMNSKKNPANFRNDFNDQVKLGNILNERQTTGDSVHQNKISSVGGDERVPQIHKYRPVTENDEYFSSVSGSLGPRICKNLELYDRVLYVQPDESIDMSHILSPVKMKNVGIEFIMQNYKKCSLEESPIQSNAMLYIDWNKTPVRLFGGAYARRTTDLCGFF